MISSNLFVNITLYWKDESKYGKPSYPKNHHTSISTNFRNITIVEWDFQYLMKIIWAKRLMLNARSHIHPSQNATVGKVPETLVVSHRLALSTMKIRVEACVIIANDATSCYDQILLPITVIATLRAGLTK